MLKTILTQASRLWEEFKNGLEKFLSLAIAVALILAWSIHRLGRAVIQQDYQTQALLRSSRRIVAPAGNVRVDNGGGRGQSISGGPVQPRIAPPEGGSTTYLPPEARVTVEPKDPAKTIGDVVKVTVTGTWGFTAEPGLDLSAAPLGAGLDLKLFYVRKLGAEIGAVYFADPVQRFSPSIGLSYRLDGYRLLKNTEAVVAYAPNSPVLGWVGIRVNF